MKHFQQISTQNIHLGIILDREKNQSLTQEEANELIQLLILYNKPDNIDDYLYHLKHSVMNLMEKLTNSIINFKLLNGEFHSQLVEKVNVDQYETLTIGEVCSIMKITRPTLDKWFEIGLKKSKVGHRVFIFKSDLEEFVKKNSLK
jgi:hypothetical protein